MVKECAVLLNNEFVTVIRYGDQDVQIPAINRRAKTVKVKDDGHYTVVPDDYIEPAKPKSRKKKPPIAACAAPDLSEE